MFPWFQGMEMKIYIPYLNVYDLLNPGALKIPTLYKNRVFQCKG